MYREPAGHDPLPEPRRVYALRATELISESWVRLHFNGWVTVPSISLATVFEDRLTAEEVSVRVSVKHEMVCFQEVQVA